MSNRQFTAVIAPLGGMWKRLFVSGALDVLIGLMSLVWPGITVLALALLLGILLLISGIAMLAFARGSAWSVVLGVISIIAAAICFAHPGAGIYAILFGAALWFLLTGFADLSVAMSVQSGRVYWATLGGLSLVAGVIMLVNPGIALATVAVVVGLSFLIRGLMELGVAWRVRGTTA